MPRLAWTGAGVLLIALAGCGSGSADHAGEPAQMLPDRWEKGFNVTAYQADAYATPGAQQQLQALRRTGTTRAAFVVTWYMDRADSNALAPDPLKTPSDASLLAGMAHARALGMTVTLKPHVDVRDGTFRGDIHPADPTAWFGAYADMIDHYAALAAQARAAGFVVGTELTSMSRREADFRRVIATARARFRGRLTYAANWSTGAEQVRFWDALDVIGIDAYMPLTREADPTVRTLERAWKKRWVKSIERLHKRYDKPVIFTELGYQARLGAAAQPQNATGAFSERAQARAYRAAYSVFAAQDWFDGIYWWDWPLDGDPTTTAPDAFSPEGKPAEDVVRRFDGAAPLPPPAAPGAGQATATAAPDSAAPPG